MHDLYLWHLGLKLAPKILEEFIFLPPCPSLGVPVSLNYRPRAINTMLVARVFSGVLGTGIEVVCDLFSFGSFLPFLCRAVLVLAGSGRDV